MREKRIAGTLIQQRILGTLMGDNREAWLLWDNETDELESLIRGSTQSQEDYGGKDDYGTL